MKHVIVTILTIFIAFQANSQNKKAPNFNITDYKGNEHNLYEDFLSQDKAVLIKFFFVDCPPCNQIAPSVQQIYTQNWDSGNGRVEFFELSVKAWDTNNKVQGYAQRHGLTFPSVSADGGSVAASDPYTSGQFGLFFGTPTFAVIGPDSIVHFGLRFDQINDTLTEVLKKDTMTGGCSSAFDIDINYWNVPIADSSNITLQLESDVQGSLTYALFEKDGKHHYECEYVLPVDNQSYFVRPKYNGPAWTDISTRDLVAIQKHLLGLKLFKHNATKIAADVNDSKTVSISDVTTIRHIILGRWAKFRMVPSHRFWAADNDFSADTFHYKVPIFESQIGLNDLTSQESSGNFGCVKMGDVTTVENNLNNVKTRNAQTLYFDIDNIVLKKNQSYNIPVSIDANSEILAIQGAFASNSFIKINDISFHGSKSSQFDSYYALDSDEQKFLWFDTDRLTSDKHIIMLNITSHKDQLLMHALSLGHSTINSLYTNQNDNEGKIELRFNDDSGIEKIKISPNPVSTDQIIIQNLTQRKITQVSIFGQNGHSVFTKSIPAEQGTRVLVQLDSNIKGLYFMQILMEDGSFEYHKIIGIGH